MRRRAISALLLLWTPAVAAAQRVPGRDLLDFPLGTLADAPTLATRTGLGIGNPAAIWIPGAHLARLSLAAVETPPDIGVSVQGFGAAGRLPKQLAVALSVVRGVVDGIPRTLADPETTPGEIPYSTMLYSLGVARRHERVLAGLAIRYRTGRVDLEQRGGLGLDAGLLADSLLGLPIRAGASTFLWRPAKGSDEETAYSAGADWRAFGVDTTREGRIGYALTLVERRTVEHYLFASGTEGRWDGNTGLLRHDSSGEVEWSLRIGIGVRRGRYHVGVARDGARDDIGGSYQFTLTTLIW